MVIVIFPYYLQCVETVDLHCAICCRIQDQLFCAVYRSRSYILSFSCENCIKLVITPFNSNSECGIYIYIYIYIHKKTCRLVVKLTKYYTFFYRTVRLGNVNFPFTNKCTILFFGPCIFNNEDKNKPTKFTN